MGRPILTFVSLSLFWGIAACGDPEEDAPLLPFDETAGLLGEGLANPFPSAHLVGEDGKLALSPDQFPAGPSPFPADLANFRTGFSPVQVATLRLPGLDCGDCPKWRNPKPGEGSVLLVDLTDNAFLPVMAELDAWPDAPDPTLLVRPQVAIPYDHQVAVVVTTSVMERPPRFDQLIQGQFDTDWTGHYQAVVDQVTGLGVNEADIALVWDFPVADGTRPTRSIVAQAEPAGDFTFPFVKEADLGDTMPDSVWRSANGTFTTTDFLDDGGELVLDMATGDVSPTGTRSAKLIVSIPHSVKDAPAGTVPVLIYGHGLQSSPEIDVYSATFDNFITRLSDELGAVIIATPWGGLDADDVLVAVGVANDLGRFPELSGAVAQGQGNFQAMLKLIREGDLADDPIFLGAQGQPLLDTDNLVYWGVSMGGILGGVATAQDASDFNAAVFHVGGSAWSSLLERSSAWTLFEGMVQNAVLAPHHRQTLYAASQLFWDPVDPACYAEDLKGKTILLQESVNDDTVPNMTTRLLARSIDLPILLPDADGPWGLTGAQADLPVGSRAMVQFDPLTATPPNENRPPPSTGAHGIPLGWWEARYQAVDFLTIGSEGQVNHYCGADVCSSSNRGTEP